MFRITLILKTWKQNLKAIFLVQKEQKELLRNNKTIMIKPAGKGGAVVILPTGHYQSIITHHISDEDTRLRVKHTTKTQSNF